MTVKRSSIDYWKLQSHRSFLHHNDYCELFGSLYGILIDSGIQKLEMHKCKLQDSHDVRCPSC